MLKDETIETEAVFRDNQKGKEKKNKLDESMELCAALTLLKVILFFRYLPPSFSGRLGQYHISDC